MEYFTKLAKLVNHKLGLITLDMFKDISYFFVLVRLDVLLHFCNVFQAIANNSVALLRISTVESSAYI